VVSSLKMGHMSLQHFQLRFILGVMGSANITLVRGHKM
jgi:hypothetical protein